MTIAHEASSGIEAATTAKGGSTTTVAYTGVAADRLAILMCTIKLGTAVFSTTNPTGWTRILDVSGGTGATAADVGTTRIGVWFRVLDGTETGNVTIVAAGSESMAGGMSVYSKTLGEWDLPIAVSGSDTGHGANRSVVCGGWATALGAGDRVVTAFGSDTDAIGAVSAPTIVQTSATFGAGTMRNQRLSSSGNDCGMYSADFSVTTGNTNAPTIGFTYATSQCGPGIAIRLRESATRYPPVQIATDTVGFLTGGATGANQDFAQLNVLLDDVLTVGTNVEDNAFTETVTTNAGTATVGAWTRIVGTNTNTNSRVAYWRATVTAPGTATIRVTITGGLPANSWWGASLRQWRNCDGTGATSAGLVQSAFMTKQAARSTILCNVSSWNATDPGTPTWNGGLSTVISGRDTGASHYSWALAKLDNAGVIGAVNFGLLSPAFGTPAMAMIEVLGSATPPAGVSEDVNQATETSIAQPIAKSKLKAIGLITETLSSRAIARIKALAVNRATETDTSRPVTFTKAKAILRATETDVARAAAPTRFIAVNRATETDTSQPIVFTKAKALGITTETDASRPITFTKTKAILRATETDISQIIRPTRFITVNRSSETDASRPITFTKAKGIGLVVETNTSRSITFTKRKAIGLILETDTARAIAHAKALLLNRATETDVARTLAAMKLRAIGMAVETDTSRRATFYKVNRAIDTSEAQIISFGGFNLVVGRIIETDTARAITSSKAKGILRATENDAARTLTVLRSRTLGIATTTAIARALTGLHARAMGSVTDSSVARTITPTKQKGISQAVETNDARAMQLALTVAIGRATDVSVSRSIGALRAYPLGLVVEQDLARPVVLATVVQLGRVTETDIARGLTKLIPLGIVVETTIAGEVIAVLGAGGVQKSPIILILPSIGVTLTDEAVGITMSITPTGLVLVEREPIGITVEQDQVGIILRG